MHLQILFVDFNLGLIIGPGIKSNDLVIHRCLHLLQDILLESTNSTSDRLTMGGLSHPTQIEAEILIVEEDNIDTIMVLLTDVENLLPKISIEPRRINNDEFSVDRKRC